MGWARGLCLQVVSVGIQVELQQQGDTYLHGSPWHTGTGHAECQGFTVVKTISAKLREQLWRTDSTMCKINSQWEVAIQHRGFSWVLCDDTEEWGAERGWWEGIYVFLQLNYIVVQQKLAQHCKSIILQFKKKAKVIPANPPPLSV